MSPDIKVTDKRLFTEDGELREEYRYLEEKKEGEGKEEAAGEPSPPPPQPEVSRVGQAPGGSPERGTAERPSSLPTPQFLDLVGLLAEPVALYLGDASGPEGKSVENLPLARFHIDLLDVLRKKSEGNLDEAERAVLEDLIYRLRLRYVEKSR